MSIMSTVTVKSLSEGYSYSTSTLVKRWICWTLGKVLLDHFFELWMFYRILTWRCTMQLYVCWGLSWYWGFGRWNSPWDRFFPPRWNVDWAEPKMKGVKRMATLAAQTGNRKAELVNAEPGHSFTRGHVSYRFEGVFRKSLSADELSRFSEDQN